PTHAYLYALPLTSGQAPIAMGTDAAGGAFGSALAAFDLDGMPGDEMFVGDQQATVGGSANAGHVTIYTGVGMAKVPATAIPNPLAMNEPNSGAGYGAGLAGMTFCPANVGGPAGDGGVTPSSDAGVAPCTRLPLVGSLSKVFAYFTLKKPDPRVK